MPTSPLTFRKAAEPLKNITENRGLGWVFLAVAAENLMHLDPALCAARLSPAAMGLGADLPS